MTHITWGTTRSENLTATCFINSSFGHLIQALHMHRALKESVTTLNQNLPAYKKNSRKTRLSSIYSEFILYQHLQAAFGCQSLLDSFPTNNPKLPHQKLPGHRTQVPESQTTAETLIPIAVTLTPIAKQSKS